MRKNIYDKIHSYVKINKLITADDIKIKLELDIKINVSKNTIINILHEMNFLYKQPITKPALTKKQIESRLDWCNKYKDYNWDNVTFTDEASIWIGFKGKRWVNLNEDDYNYTLKYPTKVHIWGSISKSFERKLYIFTEILTADGYLNILKSQLDIGQQFILQDDNDPKHRSKLVTNWKKENNIKYIDWPSNSPDLNPIENIWALLKHKIKKIYVKNITELKETILKCWNEIDDSHIQNTINSIPLRLQQVIINNGNTIKY